MPDRATQGGSSEVLVWAQDGQLLLAGEPTAVDSFLDTIDAPSRMDVSTLSSAADALAALTAAGGVAHAGGRYVTLTAESAAELAKYGPQQAGGGAIYGFVRDAAASSQAT